MKLSELLKHSEFKYFNTDIINLLTYYQLYHDSKPKCHKTRRISIYYKERKVKENQVYYH